MPWYLPTSTRTPRGRGRRDLGPRFYWLKSLPPDAHACSPDPTARQARHGLTKHTRTGACGGTDDGHVRRHVWRVASEDAAPVARTVRPLCEEIRLKSRNGSARGGFQATGWTRQYPVRQATDTRKRHQSAPPRSRLPPGRNLPRPRSALSKPAHVQAWPCPCLSVSTCAIVNGLHLRSQVGSRPRPDNVSPRQTLERLTSTPVDVWVG